MNNESLAELVALLGKNLMAEAKGERVKDQPRPVAAAGPTPGLVLGKTPPPAATKAATAGPVTLQRMDKSTTSINTSPATCVLEVSHHVDVPVLPVDRSKELTELDEANYRLARRVNSLENARVQVGCLKASVLFSVLFLFFVSVMVGAVVALAYAEHKLDVPVYTGLVRGR